MTGTAIRAAILCSVCSTLLACVFDPGEGSCAPPDPLEFFESGNYTSQGGEPVNWNCNEGCSTIFPPHEDASPLDMNLDLEAGLVTIEYDRNGEHVVERWRITQRQSR